MEVLRRSPCDRAVLHVIHQTALRKKEGGQQPTEEHHCPHSWKTFGDLCFFQSMEKVASSLKTTEVTAQGLHRPANLESDASREGRHSATCCQVIDSTPPNKYRDDLKISRALLGCSKGEKKVQSPNFPNHSISPHTLTSSPWRDAGKAGGWVQLPERANAD